MMESVRGGMEPGSVSEREAREVRPRLMSETARRIERVVGSREEWREEEPREGGGGRLRGEEERRRAARV